MARLGVFRNPHDHFIVRKLITLAITLLLALVLPSNETYAGEGLERVHFLIPAGPGGGWDGTARGVGLALSQTQLVSSITYENAAGGGGGRAIAKLIETADRQQNTLLISSTPIIVRALQGVFPQSFRDLVPIASMIADYSCFAVRADSEIQNFSDLAQRYKADPRSIVVAGGSVRGNTDHFVLAKALQLSGANPKQLIYLAYDGGGKAAAGLLSGETQVLSTGLSEALQMHQAGLLRIIAVTAPRPLSNLEDLPLLKSQGIDLVFANWRGFFAAKGLPESQYQRMRHTLGTVSNTPIFNDIRLRNGWAESYLEGDDFYAFLENQEVQIRSLMQSIGYLR